MKKLISILSLVVACVATSTHAAVISVQPVVGGYYDLSFNPIPPVYRFMINPHIIQVDVYMTAESLGPGEDSFGYAAFSFVTQPSFGYGSIKPSIVPGYSAHPYPNVDINGSAPGGLNQLFATNADLGPSSQDYEGVLVQMATGPFTNAQDPRRNVGEPNGITLPSGDSLAGPVLLGSAYFEAYGGYTITLFPIYVGAKLTNGIFVEATATTPNVIFGPWDDPEPSSVVLATIGFVGMLLRRRDA
jgi:hypothetical protein